MSLAWKSPARAGLFRVPLLHIYQTRQAFSRTIGWPALQPHVCWNSGMFDTTPFTR
jgi:hypothetical protein